MPFTCPKCLAEHEDDDSAPPCERCHREAVLALTRDGQMMFELCVEDSTLGELERLVEILRNHHWAVMQKYRPKQQTL